MMSGAILCKLAQVNFSKTTKLHEPIGGRRILIVTIKFTRFPPPLPWSLKYPYDFPPSLAVHLRSIL